MTRSFHSEDSSPNRGRDKTTGMDPIVEYERLTGRSALEDGLFALVVALPSYLEQWMRASLLSLVRELDQALDGKPSELAEMFVQPPAPWVRLPLTWWLEMTKSGLSWPEVERIGRLPPAKVMDQILGSPPLRQACAAFELARAMRIAGYVTSHGLAREGFARFIQDAVANAVRAGGVEVGDPAQIPLGVAAEMMEAARSAVADTRAQVRRKAAKAGRHSDPVQMAFALGVRSCRLPDNPTPAEIALLGAATGFEPIEPGQLSPAARRWGMRLRRSQRVGPIPGPPEGAPRFRLL
jgi:hypothetical protein